MCYIISQLCVVNKNAPKRARNQKYDKFDKFNTIFFLIIYREI